MKHPLKAPVNLDAVISVHKERVMRSMERIASAQVTRGDQLTAKPTFAGKKNATRSRPSKRLKITAPDVSYKKADQANL